MHCPAFPVMLLVPASPCISQEAGWAFSPILSNNPALLILLVPRRILRKNFSDFCVAVEVKAQLTLKGTLSALLWLIYFLVLLLSLITFLLLSHFHPFQLFLLFQPFLMPPAPTWWIGCSESWSWPGMGPSPGNKWCQTDRKWCPNKHPGPFAPLPKGRPPELVSQLNVDEMEEGEIKTEMEKFAFCVDLITWKFCTYPWDY